MGEAADRGGSLVGVGAGTQGSAGAGWELPAAPGWRGVSLLRRVEGGVGCWAGVLVSEPSLLRRVVFATGAFPMALVPGCLMCRTC